MKLFITFLCLFLLMPLEASEKFTPLSFNEDIGRNPLVSIFDFRKSKGDDDLASRLSLGRYRGFYEEGEELGNFCKTSYKVKFLKLLNKLQFNRTVFSTLQKIGIDQTIKAISSYAKELKISEDSYANMVNNFVGNFCSNDTTIMSKKKINQLFFKQFEKKNQFALPDFKKNAFFPKELDKMNSNENVLEHEFFYTVELFKSFCSWDNDALDPMLMLPLLKNRVVFQYLIRQMINQRIIWNPQEKFMMKEKDLTTTQVSCNQFFCRSGDRFTFMKNIPKGIGSSDLEYDFKNMYCESYLNMQYKVDESLDKRIKKIISKRTDDSENLLVSHFIALITGIPNFFIHLGEFNEIENFLRIPIDDYLERWASSEASKYSDHLYYEESVNVKKIDNSKYFKKSIPKFQVQFDVGLGEWDRNSVIAGKLKMSFNISIPRQLMRWILNTYKVTLPTEDEKIKEIYKRFEEQLVLDIRKSRKKLFFPPWNDKLKKIVVHELLDQILLYKGDYFKDLKKGSVKIPIIFYFGPHALQYVRYQYLVKRANRFEQENK